MGRSEQSGRSALSYAVAKVASVYRVDRGQNHLAPTESSRGMTTASGPRCHHCHTPFNGKKCYVEFCFSHLRFCSEQCLTDAAEERRKRFRAEEFRMEKHGSRWKVVDGNGELVVVACKKGATEVIRRLTRRRSRSLLARAQTEAVSQSR